MDVKTQMICNICGNETNLAIEVGNKLACFVCYERILEHIEKVKKSRNK